MTTAIVASGMFVVACAVFAVAFVGTKGGLEMPVAATALLVGHSTPELPGSPRPTNVQKPTEPARRSEAPPTIAPTAAPTLEPTAAATALPTPRATAVVPTLAPGDPLLVLRACPAHLGCREYLVVRGDTLSGIISRYLLDIDVLQALNPRLGDPNLVVVGQLLYLGRDPLARLDPCPDGERCALYVVQAGDSIAGVADRYLLTPDAVLAANPGLPRPIVAGQVIKLPRPTTSS